MYQQVLSTPPSKYVQNLSTPYPEWSPLSFKPLPSRCLVVITSQPASLSYPGRRCSAQRPERAYESEPGRVSLRPHIHSRFCISPRATATDLTHPQGLLTSSANTAPSPPPFLLTGHTVSMLLHAVLPTVPSTQARSCLAPRLPFPLSGMFSALPPPPGASIPSGLIPTHPSASGERQAARGKASNAPSPSSPDVFRFVFALGLPNGLLTAHPLRCLSPQLEHELEEGGGLVLSFTVTCQHPQQCLEGGK